MTERDHATRKAMVMTVGTGTAGGPDRLAAALAWSIDRAGAEIVTFVVTPESDRTAQTVRDIVTRDYAQANRVIEWKTVGPITNMEDANHIFGQCREAIRELGIDAQDVIVNYTSGTKAMSAAAALAGSSLGCRLAYISGEREAGIVVPGTERSIEAPPNAFQAYHDLQLAARMVQQLQFQAAITLCNDQVTRTHLSERDEQYRLNLFRIARAYDAWDKFDHRNASRYMQPIDWDMDELAAFRVEPEIIARLDGLTSAGDHRLNYTVELLADLIANAQRRLIESKWDDGVARLYRACEMLAQIGLYQGWQINTSAVDVSVLPPGVRPGASDIVGKQRKIGLEHAFKLLEFLEPEWAEEAQRSLQHVLSSTQHRNQSILAHGTNAVNESHARRFHHQCIELIDSRNPDIAELVRAHQFPWLRDEARAMMVP